MAKISKKEVINLSKKAARLEDIRQGINLVSYRRVHKNKKAYNRKRLEAIAY